MRTHEWIFRRAIFIMASYLSGLASLLQQIIRPMVKIALIPVAILISCLAATLHKTIRPIVISASVLLLCLAYALLVTIPSPALAIPGQLNINGLQGGTQNFNQLGIGGDVTGGSAKLYVNGNVGIGTTGPLERFQVQDGAISLRSSTVNPYGSLRFGTNNATYQDQWAGIDSDNESVGINVANLKFYTSYGSRSEKMRITSGGNVGIGTTNPLAKLVVSGGNQIITQNSGTTSELDLDQNGVRGWHLQNVATTGSFNINDGAVNALTILNTSGNVGIGTTNPQLKLDVYGSIGISTGSTGYFYNQNAGQPQYVMNSGGSNYGMIQNDGTGKWSLAYGPSAGTLQTPVLTWNSNGNVGIGTTAPEAKLQVMGGIYANGTSDSTGGFYHNSAANGLIVGKYSIAPWPGTNGLYVGGNTYLAVASGNVGIGTTAPIAKLDANGNMQTSVGSGGTLTLYDNDATRRNRLVAGADASGAYLNSTWGNAGSSDIRLLNSGSEAVRVTGGNVGIGTTAPVQKLSVAGTIESTSGGVKFPDGTTQTSAATGIPSGAVMFFNLAACPSGWTDLSASFGGRYIVAKPSGGTLAATVGTALTNTENRPTGQHTHTINDPGHSHNIQLQLNGGTYPYAAPAAGIANPTWVGWYGSNIINSSTTGITINNAGTVAGTNAPYVQLLICQKN